MTSLADAVAQLYGLPLGEFIGARNGLAAQAKSAQAKSAQAKSEQELSARIKRLPKPSIGVWLVNQLARHRPASLARVLGLSAALRSAQEQGDGDELRRLSRVRADVLREVIAAGRELGDELGQMISDSIAAELEQALRAALVDADAGTALVSGQLVRGLESTGFGGIDLETVLAATELSPADVLGAAIAPSSEGLDPGPQTPEAPESKASRSAASTPAGSTRSPGGRSGAVDDSSDGAAEPRSAGGRRASAGPRGAPKQTTTADRATTAERPATAEREEQQRLQREADQAAEVAAQAVTEADEALAHARRTADETAAELDEVAARLSAQRDQVRDLEIAARQARKANRDAERNRRHPGLR